MIAEVVYILCAATSFISAALLYKSYRKSHHPLLLWSSFCFAGFTLNNVMVFIDLVLFPAEISLAIPRILPALIGLTALIWGLIWDIRL
jgi:hypothetical protein